MGRFETRINLGSAIFYPYLLAEASFIWMIL